MLACALVVALAAAPDVEAVDRELAALEAQRPWTGGYTVGSIMTSVGASASVFGVGVYLAGLLAAGADLTGYGSRGGPDDGLLLAGGITIAAGLGVAFAGAAWLIVIGSQRGGELDRRATRLRAERELLAQRDHLSELELRRRRLELIQSSKPGFGPTAAMFALGSLVFTGGLMGFIVATLFLSPAGFAASLPPLAIGGGIIVGGAFDMLMRHTERSRIDAELWDQASLTPSPIASRLPAAPTFLGYAWAF